MKKSKKIFTLLGAVILVFVLAVNVLLPSLIVDKIESVGAENFNSFEVENIDISIIPSSIVLTGVSVLDTTNNNLLKNPLVISIKNVELSGLSFYSYLFSKKINISNLIVDSATCEITSKYIVRDSLNINDSAKKQLKLKGIEVDNVDLSGISLKVTTIDSLNNKSDLCANLDFAASEIGYRLGTNNSFYVARLKLNIDSISKSLPNTKQYLHVGGVSYNYPSKQLSITNILFDTKTKKKDYSKNFGYSKLWIDLIAESVKISDVDIGKIINDKNIFVENIEIYKLRADLSKDKSYPQSRKYKPFFLSLLNKAKFGISIDSTIVKDCDIVYEEIGEKNHNTSKIHFNNVNVSVLDISNQAKINSKFRRTNFAISGVVENELPITLNISIDNTSQYFSYKANGTIGTGDLSALNGFFENKVGLIVKSGTIENSSFKYHGNYDYAVGEVNFRYTNLKTETVSNSKIVGLLKKWLLSLSNVVIRKNNPEHEKLKIGTIYHCRDKYKGFANLYFGAIFNGLIDVVAPNVVYSHIAKVNEEELNRRGYNKPYKEKKDVNH